MKNIRKKARYQVPSLYSTFILRRLDKNVTHTYRSKPSTLGGTTHHCRSNPIPPTMGNNIHERNYINVVFYFRMVIISNYTEWTEGDMSHKLGRIWKSLWPTDVQTCQFPGRTEKSHSRPEYSRQYSN
jgi:hypothetical protein